MAENEAAVPKAPEAVAPAPTGVSPDGLWRYTVGPDGADVWTRIAAPAPVVAPVAPAPEVPAEDEFTERVTKLAQGVKDLLVGEGKDIIQTGKKKGLRILDGLLAVVDEGGKKK